MINIAKILPIVTFLTFSACAFASEECKEKSKLTISPIILPVSSSPKLGSPVDSPTAMRFSVTPTFGSNSGTPITVETTSDSTVSDLTKKVSGILDAEGPISLYCPCVRSPKASYKNNSSKSTPIVTVSGITSTSNVTALKSAPIIYVVKTSAFKPINTK